MGRFSAVLKVELYRRDVGTYLLKIAGKDGEKVWKWFWCPGWGRIVACFLNFNSFCLLLLFKRFGASAVTYLGCRTTHTYTQKVRLFCIGLELVMM